MTKTIKAGSRNVTIRTRPAGLFFATVAIARIGGKSFESPPRPYGFHDAAIADVERQIAEWQAER
jgi:hypothetical protein